MDFASLVRLGIHEEAAHAVSIALALAAVYLAFPPEYRKNFLITAAVPAVIGGLFPDAFYAFFYYVFRSNLHNFSHDAIFLMVTVPLSQAKVLALKRLLKIELPEKWYIVCALMTIGMAYVHLALDAVGY